MTVSAGKEKMSRLPITLGFWSALSIVATFVVFTVCFATIPLTSPLFTWTDLAG